MTERQEGEKRETGIELMLKRGREKKRGTEKMCMEREKNRVVCVIERKCVCKRN